MLFLRTFVFFFFFFFISFGTDDATAAVLYVLSWKRGPVSFFFPLLGAFIRLPHTLFLFRSK